MLLALAQWLAQDIRFFNVFNYITLRTVLAAMTALMISFMFGPGVIRWLTLKKIGQAVRDDGPQTHLVKKGTPTMGGLLILIAIGTTVLLWGDLTNKYVWTVLVVTLGYGIVGWYDDWKKVVYRDPKGLSAKWKYFWQSVIVLIAAFDGAVKKLLERSIGAQATAYSRVLFMFLGLGAVSWLTMARVVRGEVFDVAVDVRQSSPTFGQWVGVHLSADNKRQLWVPPGFAHGFLVLSESAEFLYKTTDFYAPQHECCIRWDDPAIGIEWPLQGVPLLSAKDQAGKLFREAEVFA